MQIDLNDRVSDSENTSDELKRDPDTYNEVLNSVKEALSKSNALDNQIQAIQNKGGISQESASHLKEIDDKSINIPITYFTTHCSVSHLHIALESALELKDQIDKDIVNETVKLLSKLIDDPFIAPTTERNELLEEKCKEILNLNPDDETLIKYQVKFEEMLSEEKDNLIAIRVASGQYKYLDELIAEAKSNREILNNGIKTFNDSSAPNLVYPDNYNLMLTGFMGLQDYDKSDIDDNLINFVSGIKDLEKDIEHLYDLLADLNNVNEYPKMLLFLANDEIEIQCRIIMTEFIAKGLDYFITLEKFVRNLDNSKNLICNQLIQLD